LFKDFRVDEIKALVEGWCNAIAPIVTSYYNEQRKAKAKK